MSGLVEDGFREARERIDGSFDELREALRDAETGRGMSWHDFCKIQAASSGTNGRDPLYPTEWVEAYDRMQIQCRHIESKLMAHGQLPTPEGAIFSEILDKLKKAREVSPIQLPSP